MSNDDRVVPFAPKRKTARCPNCGRPTVADHRPFCSPRCADADLGRWLTGSYRIPTEEAPADGEPRPEDDG
jgi:endogenous inhibitor of DNA gyrase (YacG/DUF329 family)